MGFFDKFGAGGGKLDIKPDALQYGPGQQLAGKVVFVGGSRSQNITNIKLRVVVSMTEQVKGPQGVQSQQQQKDICPEAQLSGPFQTQPGQTYELPFQFQLPQALPPSQKGHTEYKLLVSADIPGEIDPGDAQEINIMQGAPMGAAMGAPMGAPMMASPMPMAAPMPMAPPPIAIGAQVLAQWQDGNWYPAQVVAMQNGMIGVDWADPRLGQSSWVQPTQVRAGGGAMPPPMMAPPPAMAPQVGAKVQAQWQDGNWYPAMVVAIQNGMVGVDWIDKRLGASSWVQPTQVRA